MNFIRLIQSLSTRELLAVLIVLPVAVVLIPPTVHFADALATTQNSNDTIRLYFRFIGAAVDAGLYAIILAMVLYGEGKLHPFHKKR